MTKGALATSPSPEEP